MIPDPILVVSMPRSGSSMVAGAFARHGVWTGTCRPANQHNPRGYYESLPIERLIGRVCGHRVNRGEPAPKVDGWRDMVEASIRRDGYGDGPWLWKGSALYAPLWHEFSPAWVVVRRRTDAVRASGRASGRYGASVKSVRAHQAIIGTMDDAAFVDADAVAGGDYSTLELALESAGLTPDRAILDDWIDPALWTHSA